MISDSKNVDDTSSLDSSTFKRLQLIYLVGYVLAAAGNSLQGSYRYAIYESYGIQRSTIELLFAGAHASTLFLGTLISSLSDKYGRRLSCILCGVVFIISCVALNFSPLWVLAIGTVFRGVAHSLFNTNFEAWLIEAHHQTSLNAESLKRILRNAFLFGSFVAIITGVIAQFSVEKFGAVAPFDIAIGCFIAMIIFVSFTWTENYGDKEGHVTTSFIYALRLLRDDPRIVLLGLSTAFFEATLYIYLIEWTPALQEAKTLVILPELPLGLIFSAFMTWNMIGSFVFELLSKRFQTHLYMIAIFLLSAIGLTIPIIFSNSQLVILCSFFLFEFSVGIYRPTMSLLRSQFLPNKVRATVMNYFRIPRFVFMFGVILWHFSIRITFAFCVGMILLSLICLLIACYMKSPKDEMDTSETKMLLDQSLPIDLKLKETQIQSDSSNSFDHKNTEMNMKNIP